jgi:hypothetical protein
MTGYTSKKMLSDARLPDTPSARMILRKMLEDDDTQTYQRTWVGLTDEEIAYAYTLEKKFAMQYVDAKLKEKNFD